MAAASEGNLAQGPRESEGVYIPLAGVFASGANESTRRHEGGAESTVVVRDANDRVVSEGTQEVTSTLAQSAEAVRPGGVRRSASELEPWLSSCRAVEAPSSRCQGAVKALPVEPVE